VADGALAVAEIGPDAGEFFANAGVLKLRTARRVFDRLDLLAVVVLSVCTTWRRGGAREPFEIGDEMAGVDVVIDLPVAGVAVPENV
jgi:hypothetical protein